LVRLALLPVLLWWLRWLWWRRRRRELLAQSHCDLLLTTGYSAYALREDKKKRGISMANKCGKL
jgi:hypothetical protein